MNNSNRCPKCGQYIFGNYCHTCNGDIRNMEYPDTSKNPLQDLFENITDNPFKDFFDK
jgi:hypothetical protein